MAASEERMIPHEEVKPLVVPHRPVEVPLMDRPLPKPPLGEYRPRMLSSEEGQGPAREPVRPEPVKERLVKDPEVWEERELPPRQIGESKPPEKRKVKTWEGRPKAWEDMTERERRIGPVTRVSRQE